MGKRMEDYSGTEPQHSNGEGEGNETAERILASVLSNQVMGEIGEAVDTGTLRDIATREDLAWLVVNNTATDSLRSSALLSPKERFIVHARNKIKNMITMFAKGDDNRWKDFGWDDLFMMIESDDKVMLQTSRSDVTKGALLTMAFAPEKRSLIQVGRRDEQNKSQAYNKSIKDELMGTVMEK